MNTKKNKEIVLSESKEIILASAQLTRRGLDIINELIPRTIHVPNDYPTITKALKHAVDGDTIELAEGIYQETLRINKSVSIIGTSQSCVIIESPNKGPIILYEVYNGISKVKNVVIRSRSDKNWSMGIMAIGIYFEFENCQFEDFSYREYYLNSIDCKDNFRKGYIPCCAVSNTSVGSKMKFSNCSFISCDKAVEISNEANIDFTNCKFMSTATETTISIEAWEDCRIRSNFCYFRNGSVQLGSNSYYESSYDTFVDVDGIITAYSTCRATFSHATIDCLRLLSILNGNDISGPDRNATIWSFGKPKIHFSNSIVLVKDGFNSNFRFAKTLGTKLLAT